MAGPSPLGLEPFKNLKEPNGSFILNWVGFTPRRIVRMESGSGRNERAGSGPTGRPGPIYGSMIPDPGSTSKEIGKVANRSSSTTPVNNGDKNHSAEKALSSRFSEFKTCLA